MVALTRMQDDFQSYLLRKAEGVESHVVGTERVPIATRLAIYGDGYSLRLIEALQANYPALAKLLGDDEFPILGAAYVQANDSHFRSVRYYGAGLPDFLTTQMPFAKSPLLAELARWEWTMTEVFDAADAEPIGVEALAAVHPESWPELRFDLHPSVRRLGLFWNAPQIWKALTSDEERPKAAVLAEPGQWALWRQGLANLLPLATGSGGRSAGCSPRRRNLRRALHLPAPSFHGGRDTLSRRGLSAAMGGVGLDRRRASRAIGKRLRRPGEAQISHWGFPMSLRKSTTFRIVGFSLAGLAFFTAILHILTFAFTRTGTTSITLRSLCNGPTVALPSSSPS